MFEKKLKEIKEHLEFIKEESEHFDAESLCDPCGTLRQIKSFVEDMDKRWSDILKQEDSVKGRVFQTETQTVLKTILDTDKVKKFLGVRLSDYQKTNTEIHLKFKPRF